MFVVVNTDPVVDYIRVAFDHSSASMHQYLAAGLSGLLLLLLHFAAAPEYSEQSGCTCNP